MEGKIGFIGMGSMAQAILRGWKSTALFAPEQFAAYAPHRDKLLRSAGAIGFTPCEDCAALVRGCRVLIMACKPDQVEGVLEEVGPLLSGRVLLSVAAGWPFARYEPLLPQGTRCQFIMPNTPAMVREGVFLFEEANSLTPEEGEEVRRWFAALGAVETVPARLMSVAGATAGSGPAFVDLMMEAFADAAVSYGMPRDMAYRLVAQMVVGSGRLLQESGQHPGALKDAVCSPGGSTILGVEALEQAGFRAACQAAIHAAMRRA